MLAGIIPQGHLNFGADIGDAMDKMWRVNSANQQASLASQAIGGGRGGGNGSLWDAYMGFNLSDPHQARKFGDAKIAIRQQNDADFQQQLRNEQARRDMLFNDWNRRGFGSMLSGMFGGGSGGGMFGQGSSYNTNFGASGYAN